MSAGPCPTPRKKRFDTRHEARTAARLTAACTTKGATHCSVYRCTGCGDYHVTSQTRGQQKAMRRRP